MVKDGHVIDVPLLATCRHLLQPSGKIVGKDVAEAILPVFPTFCSAIPLPTPLGPLRTSAHAPRLALASIDGRTPLTHERIRNFCVRDFGPTLHSLGFGKGDRIALVLPNGPELALAIFATAHWASCVPLSANGAVSELEADLLRCGATLVIGPYSGRVAPSNSTKASRSHKRGESGNVFAFDFSNQTNTSNNNLIRTNSSNSNDADRFNVSGSSPNRDWSAFRTAEEAAAKVGIPFVGLVPSPEEAGIFSLQSTRLPHPLQFDKVSLKSPSIDRQGSLTYDAPKLPLSRRNDGKSTGIISTEPNTHTDEVLVLFTSGTTGSKKLVPHVMGDMLTAAATIALSWDLCPSDVNCNLMPLFHVGGIVRQIFSPIFSGGCVICCPSFDPTIFWSLLAKRAFTWYYAAPTMHQLILQTGKSDGFINAENGQCPLKLRMIANAAGGLLPSLAKEMLQVFDATVLPSYGMTECMPITSPPSTYRLDKTGTSGVSVGPELAILNTTTCVPLLPGEEGTICVRGEPCFRGYGKIANDDSEEATPETFLDGGWFNTGVWL